LGVSNVLENTHPDNHIREAAELASQELIALATELSLNQQLYQAIAAVDVSAEDSATQWLKTKLVKEFRRSGVDRDAATRQKIQQLQEELTKLQQTFERNIREDKRSISVTPEELAGLPDDYKRNHPVDDQGRISITTDYNDYRPFMTYADSTDRRRELFLQFNNRAYPANTEVLVKMVQVSQALAELLQFKTYADYVLDNKMAQETKRVQAFIDELKPAAYQRAATDYQLLLQQKRLDDPEASVVYQYEASYYLEKLKTASCQLDSQALRNYFPYAQVRDGLFRLVEQAFDIQITPEQPQSVWHEEVEYYQVRERDQLIGSFYLDMHPRTDKYNHAAQFHLQAGVSQHQLPIPVLVCNFPGGKSLAPADSLMTHDEVETFFHEFGHLLHTLFGGQQRWLENSGTSTEWDFVEVPSQFWEELVWTPAAVKTFARHHETGEGIPDDLLHNLIASKHIDKGAWLLRQLRFTQLSLTLFQEHPETLDPLTLSKSIESQYSLYPAEPEEHFIVNFGHLANYTAAYYTYMWSLAIVHDFIKSGTDNNLMNVETLKIYRQTILNPGGSKPARELISDFLGRDYTLEAFKSWLLN
jgi:thimet oligopeptidase